jgi:hypothetical protein
LDPIYKADFLGKVELDMAALVAECEAGEPKTKKLQKVLPLLNEEGRDHTTCREGLRGTIELHFHWRPHHKVYCAERHLQQPEESGAPVKETEVIQEVQEVKEAGVFQHLGYAAPQPVDVTVYKPDSGDGIEESVVLPLPPFLTVETLKLHLEEKCDGGLPARMRVFDIRDTDTPLLDSATLNSSNIQEILFRDDADADMVGDLADGVYKDIAIIHVAPQTMDDDDESLASAQPASQLYEEMRSVGYVQDMSKQQLTEEIVSAGGMRFMV